MAGFSSLSTKYRERWVRKLIADWKV